MANPLAYVPKKADPRNELQRRLDAAPIEHAEALLVAYDLLEEAHRQGILDALHGAISARDTIISDLARVGDDPAALNTVRNLIAVGKLLGSFDPQPFSEMAREANDAMEQHKKEKTAPSMWELFRRMRREDTRRGLAFMMAILAALGRATR